MTESEYQKLYRRIDPEKEREKQAACVKRLQIEMYAAYGNKCQCCGESNLAFLTMDHVNNDGSKDRMRNSKRVHNMILYRDLKAEGWPPRVRLLCYNCNCARKNNNGVCPHVEIVSISMKMLLGMTSSAAKVRKGAKHKMILRDKDIKGML